MEPTFNHLFDVAFDVESKESEPEAVSLEELLSAAYDRLLAIAFNYGTPTGCFSHVDTFKMDENAPVKDTKLTAAQLAFRKALFERMKERVDVQGEECVIDLVIGATMLLEVLKHPLAQHFLNLSFLVSVRGMEIVNAILKKAEAA